MAVKRNRVFATHADFIIHISLQPSFVDLIFLKLHMISVSFNNLSLKYQRYTPLSGNDIGNQKIEFVVKIQLESFRKL